MPDAKKKRKPTPRTACISPSNNRLPHTLRLGPTAMIQTDPIFLGVVPRGARSYVAREIVRLGKPLFNACAGRFSIIEAAVKSGFPSAKVHASDIGLFSSLSVTSRTIRSSLEDLGIRILDPDLEPRGREDELDFAAHVMLILKMNQLSQTNLRGLYLREELRASWSRYRQAVREELADLVRRSRESTTSWPTSGTSSSACGRRTSPFFAEGCAHYARGYEKMFSAPNLTWNEPAIPQFDPKRFPELLQQLGKAQCTALLCRRGDWEEEVPPPLDPRFWQAGEPGEGAVDRRQPVDAGLCGERHWVRGHPETADLRRPRDHASVEADGHHGRAAHGALLPGPVRPPARGHDRGPRIPAAGRWPG